MKKRISNEETNKIAIDINELQTMLSIGKNTAIDLGEKAGAVIRIGRRKLYNVKKIENYIDSITEA